MVSLVEVAAGTVVPRSFLRGECTVCLGLSSKAALKQQSWKFVSIRLSQGRCVPELGDMTFSVTPPG